MYGEIRRANAVPGFAPGAMGGVPTVRGRIYKVDDFYLSDSLNARELHIQNECPKWP